ncbi:LPS biosynthesis glycosyltransferase [[Phormidium ambiguum] IAM M-71]|uniref:LPS biosynthesis glycosyltransferase n=1 Tax=[Phormidium ambiguum] IAM M-71 TaxID=454136 RepID=A0A1U7IR26_9CYAN|nr:LPS biosynthesis glycosyltransferase [Phormidium ambiguum IAM M-71]
MPERFFYSAKTLQFRPQRIVVLRALVGLGDFLCAVPTWRSLRAAFPEAQIILIGSPQIKPLFDRFRHYLDELWEFPGFPGLPELTPQLEQIPLFLQYVQSQNFDLAVQMHGSGTVTNPLIKLFAARICAGFFAPGEYCPDERSFLPYLAHESEVRRYLRLLEYIGIPSQGEELEFPLWEEDEQAFREIPEAQELRTGEFVCIHPGASTPLRCWSPSGFAAVADAVANLGFRVVFTGSQHEINLTKSVAAKMQAPSLNLAGRTSLGALATLLTRARLVICNDTGVSHLAAALKVPSVVVFTISDPDRWAPLNEVLHRAIYDSSGVPPEMVIAQTFDLLMGLKEEERISVENLK